MSLGPLTTYRVGGAAALFTTVETFDDLRRVRGMWASKVEAIRALVRV